MTLAFPVDDSSRVAEVRRFATNLARDENLDKTSTSSVSIVATEISTNLLKHAQRGEIFISTLSDRNGRGIEILSIDRGPGIVDVARCLKDGYSSTDTAGTGLGAIARLSRDFDIYSEGNKGTVLISQIGGRGSGARTSVGVVVKPITGEEVAGDSWALAEDEEGFTLLVADGLGHGLLAAKASMEAVAAFRRSGELTPLPVLMRVHEALRGTRGAAVAVARVEFSNGTVRYAGLGNIAGTIVGAGKPVGMVSHNGTAGFNMPRLQEFTYTLHPGSLLVMHSDGLSTNWNLSEHPGLQQRHPSIVAGVLYRDASRNRDDVCVVVVKMGSTA